jgi:RNA recognition motif-containing protein
MNIYVGNLSLEVTAEDLRREFTAFGAVLSVAIMSDSYIGSGQPRGYGFVEMATKSEGALAIAHLQGKTLKSREIAVVEALPLSDTRESSTTNVRLNKQPNRKVRQRKY